ncbi:MAG TPA: hypothetical protein VFF11_15120, partial [Candidatus Binatia bacterium]|nr:hypothetical protein [Candidatus Binatia bacterium]
VICLAAVWLFFSQRLFLCGLAISVGIGVKLYPALFVPPLFILAFRLGKWKSFTWGFVIGLLPLLLLSFYLPWWQFAQFQADRGLQVESLYASILWLGKQLGWFHLNWIYTKMWYEVQGVAASALLPWSRALFAGTVSFSVVLSTWSAWRLDQPSPTKLSRILLLPLLAFMVFNQVLSPQYMIWLLPLAALTALEGDWWLGMLIAFATMLTPIIYPSLYQDYGEGLNLFETVILLMRNMLLVMAWMSLIRFCRKVGHFQAHQEMTTLPANGAGT